MRTTISIPGREILRSGSLILSETQPAFRITIEDIVLDFAFRPGAVEPAADVEQPTPKSVRFTLSGFENPLGTSYALDEIVTIAGRTVSVICYVHANSNAPIRRMVTYTLSTSSAAT